MAVLGTTNISTTKVRNALGENTHDVGSLCKSSKINMWSKRKPVRRAVDFIADPSEVGKTLDHNWGLQLTGFNVPGDDNQRTEYNRPTGGSSRPYRLGDFRGYNHNAQIPLSIPPQSIDHTVYRTEFSISAIAVTDDPDSLSLLDFGLRLGCYVYNHENNLFLGSSSAKYNGGVSVSIDLTNYTSVDYVDIYFFLTDNYKEWGPGSITPRYEPFRPESGIMKVNQHWREIELADYQSGHSRIVLFNITHDPGNGINDHYIDIDVKTNLYTGTLTIRITHIGVDGNLKQDDYFTLNITESGTVVTFRRKATWIQLGRTYNAMIWMGNGSGSNDKECSFIALMEA